ncbi:alanine:cation symporter family protein [Anaerotignum faecicola]|nr:alanine:cation symporter family protein [Anaerotignum faecicola]
MRRSARAIHPIMEGIGRTFEVFADTIIVCSITALAVPALGQYGT